MTQEPTAENDAPCEARSPESGMPCSLPNGHPHAHAGPHPTGYEGWNVSWANRPIPPAEGRS